MTTFYILYNLSSEYKEEEKIDEGRPFENERETESDNIHSIGH